MKNNHLPPTLLLIALLALTPRVALQAQAIHPRVEAYMDRCNSLISSPVILRMADTLERLSLQTGDTTGIVSAPVLPFHYYLHTQQEDSLDHYAQRARQTALQYGRLDYYYMVWERWISYQIVRRRYTRALDELQQMQQSALDNHNPEGLQSCYKNLSLVYYYKNNLDQALAYARQAIEASRQIADNEYETGLCELELARILNKAGRHQEAERQLLAAMAQADKALATPGERDLMGALLGSMLTTTRVALGDNAGARQALQAVDRRAPGNHSYYDITKAHSDYYCAIGHYREALLWQEQFYQTLGTTHTLNYYRDVSDILLHIPGREREAATLLQAYTRYSDSIHTAEEQANFEEIAANMDLYRLESENQRMHLRASHALIAATLLLLALCVFFAIYFYHLWHRLKAATQTKRQMEDQLSVGQNIQMSMLHTQFPDSPSYDLCATLHPALAVSGDLYDFFEHQGKLYFIIADVAGKGVAASLYMSVITYIFRAQARHCSTAAELLQSINHVVAEENPNAMFSTAICGILQLNNGALSLANAGHNLPIGMTRHGDSHAPCTLRKYELSVNLPLGIEPHLHYTGHESTLQPGDQLFLYTDGVTAAEDRHHALYGQERLTAFLMAHADSSAREIVNLVSTSVRDYSKGMPQSDDITLMAIKYIG